MPVADAQLAREIENLRQQYAMAGEQSPYGEISEGQDLLPYVLDTYYHDPNYAYSLAERYGIPKEQLDQQVAATSGPNPRSTGSLGRVLGGIGRAVGAVGNTVEENPALLFAAPLAIGALGGAFGGGAAASGAGAGAGAGGAATTYPLAAGGAISATPIAAGASAVAPAVAASGAATGAGMAANWLNWANLGNTVLGVYGADRAADAQVSASNAAVDESHRQYDQTRTDFQPSIDLLGTSAGLLRQYLNGDTSVFTRSPGYQDELAEGQKAIDRSASARGKALSGPSVREGIRYATSLSDRDSGSFVNRLLAAAGLGAAGATTTANAGTNSAALVGSAQMAGGNARASGYANQYGALQGGVSNLLLQRYMARP